MPVIPKKSKITSTEVENTKLGQKKRKDMQV